MLIRILLYPIAISIYAIFMYLCHQEVEWGKESVAWPTTQARLIQASYGGKQNALLYSFSVAGKQYTGKRLQFCSKNSPELKDYFYSHINNKSEITISYQPSDPSLSVAKPGMDDRKFYFYAFSSVAFLVAILIIEIYVQKFSTWKRRPKQPSSMPTPEEKPAGCAAWAGSFLIGLLVLPVAAWIVMPLVFGVDRRDSSAVWGLSGFAPLFAAVVTSPVYLLSQSASFAFLRTRVAPHEACVYSALTGIALGVAAACLYWQANGGERILQAN